ncbi:large subunit GTPase 1 homolog [Trichonephila clavipes]|nr:large subunit GTPase 1 homolog [Trichonephila clavipes]
MDKNNPTGGKRLEKGSQSRAEKLRLESTKTRSRKRLTYIFQDFECTNSENVAENSFLNQKNSPDTLSREQLIQFFKQILSEIPKIDNHVPTVGLVGYPNVGKSSTLNALLMTKRVSVSATPGKTKHFQTFLIDNDLCLCDCPGLVFPNFVSTKAEMVINGILPIDQLTEWKMPVTLISF